MSIYKIILSSAQPSLVPLWQLPQWTKLAPDLQKGLSILLYSCFHVPALAVHQPGTIYILIEDQSIVSTAAVSQVEEGNHLIYNVCTYHEYRGRGFMTKLLRTIFEDLSGATFYLQVEANNVVAYRLYSQLGFIPVERNGPIYTMKFG